MQKLLSRAFSVFGLAVFILALWVLREKLRELRWSDVAFAMEMVTSRQIALAVAFTCLSTFAASLYDLLGLHAIKAKISVRRALLTSWICNIIGHNVGCSSLTGGSMRWRLYSEKGLSGKDVLRLVSFNALTFWLGLFALGGLIFYIAPPEIAASLGPPFSSAQLIGGVLLLLLLGYLIWSVRHETLHMGSRTVPVPGLRVSLGQIAAGSVEWILGAGILYALLPHAPGLAFGLVLRTFMLAHLMGMTSQAPAGLGVFETVVLKLLPGHLPASEILGALLLYRLIYNVIPLLIASALLAAREISAHRTGMSAAACHCARWGRRLIREPEKK